MSSKQKEQRKKKQTAGSRGNPKGRLLTVRNTVNGDEKTVYEQDFRGSKWRNYVIKT